MTAEASLDGLTGLVPGDVGLRVADGPALFFAKTPLRLATGAPRTTITLTSAVDGYLAWVPARVWTSGGGRPLDVTPWMATTLVLEGCSDTPSTYLGGLLSTTPGMCLTLTVSQGGASPHRTLPAGAPTAC